MHPALDAIDALADHFARTERALRRSGRSLPPAETCDETGARLFAAVDACERAVASGDVSLEGAQGHFETRVGPWLYRSELYWRSRFKPHGYAGDFRIVEAMYDLEESGGQDPGQSALQNVLDATFARVHSVVGIWDRRRALRELLARAYDERGGRLRVLDVACGGARYVHDFLEEPGVDPRSVEVTLLDQDPAAAAFCRARFAGRRVDVHCLPIRRIEEVLAGRSWDVVISAGLFDYLDDGVARAQLSRLAGALRDGGRIALSNYHPEDRSAFFKVLVGRWPLIFRDEAAVGALFPAALEVRTERSKDGSLAYAVARRCEA